MKIVVTGGSGSVGRHLREYLPDAVYLSSKDCNLLSQYHVQFMLDQQQPDVIIHLAAVVGGLKDNLARPVTFLEDNLLMNTNIIREAYNAGVKNFLGILSTCIYPDTMMEWYYPLEEKNLFSGNPPDSNKGYAYAKRMMALQLDLYREQFGLNYGYLIPCNLYSEYDNMDDTKSHFVTALLHKLAKAKSQNETHIKLMGTGKPLRQFMHSSDLARAIAISITSGIYNNCNVCVDENKSIREIAELAISVNDLDIKLEFSGDLDGQFRKDVSNSKFKRYHPDFEFTPLAEGLKSVYDKISERYN